MSKIRFFGLALLAMSVPLNLWGQGVRQNLAPTATGPNSPSFVFNQTTSSGQIARQQAASNNQFLFILFWNVENDNLRAMKQSLQGWQANHPQTAMVMVKTSDPTEKSLVDQFDVARAPPLPLLIVLAPNGAIKGATRSK